MACVMMLVLFLIALEVLLRVLWGAPLMHFPPDAVREDPAIGFGLVPNFHGRVNNGYFRGRFDTNSQGFRDSERAYEKPTGVYRVLVIGDSFVQGFGLDERDTFASVLERELKARNGRPPVEVMKMGVGGWGPSNYWRVLRNVGARYSPDFVVVAFYPGNDFQEAETEHYNGVWNGVWLKRAAIEHMTRLRALRVSLWKHVYLYGFLDSIVTSVFLSDKYQSWDDRDNLRLCLPESKLPPDKSTKESLLSIRDWCKEHNVKLRILILPHRIDVERKRSAEVAAKYGMDANQLDYLRPMALMDRYFRDLSIEVWNPTCELRDWAADGKAISFNPDHHYVAATHAFLAKEYLLPKLEKTVPVTLH
jgi:hypothetical protein